MKISSDDIELLAGNLEAAINAGSQYLCYWEQADYFQSHDLYFFKDKYQASEFCFEESTDRDTYDVTLISPVLAVVKNFMEQLSVLGENAAHISFPFSIAEIEHQHRINEKFKNKEMENENVANEQGQVMSTGSENNLNGQSESQQPSIQLEGNLPNPPSEEASTEESLRNQVSIDPLERLLKAELGEISHEELVRMKNNVLYLENQILKTGFGEITREDLIKNIIQGKDGFQLTLEKKYGNDEAIATLNLNRSDKGNYFFNSYDLAVKNEGEKQAFKQTFRINYGNTFTLKEAFNLMQGRSVFKEFVKVDKENKENNQKYSAWATMDLKESDTEGNHSIKKSYRLNLDAELALYPFKELENHTYRKELIDSLHRGNRQMVTYVSGDKAEKMYVEANAVHNSLKLHDAQMNPIRLSMKLRAASETTDIKEGQATEVKEGQNTREFEGRNTQKEANKDNELTAKKTRGKNRKVA